jgi:hypothetical protein
MSVIVRLAYVGSRRNRGAGRGGCRGLQPPPLRFSLRRHPRPRHVLFWAVRLNCHRVVSEPRLRSRPIKIEARRQIVRGSVRPFPVLQRHENCPRGRWVRCRLSRRRRTSSSAKRWAISSTNPRPTNPGARKLGSQAVRVTVPTSSVRIVYSAPKSGGSSSQRPDGARLVPGASTNRWEPAGWPSSLHSFATSA